jgi:hypothetical protein
MRQNEPNAQGVFYASIAFFRSTKFVFMFNCPADSRIALPDINEPFLVTTATPDILLSFAFLMHSSINSEA